MAQRLAVGHAFRFAGRKNEGLSGMEGKPFHPPLTDIPMGAYVIAPVLDVIAFFGRNSSWGPDLHTAAGYTLLVGACFSVLTVVTGVADWRRMEPGSLLRRMANAHALAMVATTLLVVSNLLLRFNDNAATTTGGVLALSGVVLAIVTIGGMIGGSLVYDHGYRVRTSPTAQEEPPATHHRFQRRAG